VKSCGRLGAPAYALFCRAADGGGISKVAFIESALQELSVTGCKGMHASWARIFCKSLRPAAART
jgi:hypothetical protein